MIEEYFHNCLYFTVSRLSRVVTRHAEEAFKKTGLSPTYAYLMMLVIEKPGISQKDLCEKLYITQSTITRFIDKLVSKELVRRAVEGKNSLIYPTDKGKDIQSEIKSSWHEFYLNYTRILGEKESENLVELTDNASNKLESID